MRSANDEGSTCNTQWALHTGQRRDETPSWVGLLMYRLHPQGYWRSPSTGVLSGVCLFIQPSIANGILGKYEAWDADQGLRDRPATKPQVNISA